MEKKGYVIYLFLLIWLGQYILMDWPLHITAMGYFTFVVLLTHKHAVIQAELLNVLRGNKIFI